MVVSAGAVEGYFVVRAGVCFLRDDGDAGGKEERGRGRRYFVFGNDD